MFDQLWALKKTSINKDRALVFKSAFGTHHNLSGDLSSLLSFDNFYLKSNISFFFFFLKTQVNWFFCSDKN